MGTRAMSKIALRKPQFGRVIAACAGAGLCGACDRGEPDQGSSSQQSVSVQEQPAHDAAARDAQASTDPESDAALLGEAARLASQREFEAARRVAAEYAARHPDDGRADFIIGLTYYGAGNRGRAVPHFERALELSPDYTLTRRYYGECLFLLGDMDGARREYKAWCAAEPDDPTSHYLVGVVDFEQTRLDDAVARFGRAIELFEAMDEHDPRRRAFIGIQARCHAKLGEVHFVRGEYEAARRELVAATEADPRYISAYYSLSQVYRRLGEDELAEQALARFQQAKQAMIEQGGERE